MFSRTDWICGVCLAVATVFLYWPAAEFDFVNLDDISYVIENQMVQGGLTAAAARDALTGLYQVMWAPGLWISYMIDVELFGMNPRGFHVTNIVLHVSNTMLLYVLFCFWTRKPFIALLATAFWAWHPLRVESVAWVSARKDVLSGFFFITCIGLYYLAHRGSRAESSCPSSKSRHATMLLLSIGFLTMALGLSVKPVLVTIPAVMLLVDIWPLQRLNLTGRICFRSIFSLALAKWPFWLLSIIFSFIAVYAHEAGTSLMDLSLWTRLAIVPSNYSFYLLKTVDPRNLTVLYGSFEFNFLDIAIAFSVFGIFTYLFWIYRQHFLCSLTGWLWFLAVMLPTSGIVRFGAQSLADRFTYLPSIGFSIILLASALIPVSKWRKRCIAAIIIALGLMVSLTTRQLPVWKNSEQLYENLLKQDPTHGFALSDRASRLWRNGQLDEAMVMISKAVESPTHSDTQRIMKAELLAATGQPEAARDYLLTSSYMSPGSSAGLKYFALAMISNQLEMFSDGLHYLMKAAQTLSRHDALYRDINLLAVTLHYRLDDQWAALEWARRIPGLENREEIRLPDLLPYYLGQWKRLQRHEAVAYFRELIQAEPAATGAINNLTWLMATAAWSPMPPEEILGLANRIYETTSRNPVIVDSVSVAYAHAGHFEQAIDFARQAQRLLFDAGQADSDFYGQISLRIAGFQEKRPWRDERVADRLIGGLYHSNP
jgi:hypothetical protein